MSKADGGAVASSLTSIPVRGLDTSEALTFSKSGSAFVGMLGPLSGADGDKRFVAGWDAGPNAEITLRYDTAAPMFDVQLVGAPAYGSDGGFLGMDPAETGTVVKKDETVTLRVTSTSTDVRATSFALTVSVPVDAGVEVWDAGVAANCGAAAFCREFTLALGPQPLRDFAAGVNVVANAEDNAGNLGSAMRTGLFRVTRWKWARMVTNAPQSLKGAPAIDGMGDVYLPSAANPVGIFRVTPMGSVSQESNAGPVEGGIAIGSDGTTQRVFYLTTNGGLRVLSGGENCGAASATNVSSLAILDDGQTGMHGVGVVGDATTRQLIGVRPGTNCAPLIISAVVPQAASAVFPGNVVVDGQSLWYPATGGVVKRFTRMGTVFGGPTDITGLGSGTVFGLSLFSGGTKLAGGRGTAGGGRLFVRNSDGSGSTTGYEMMGDVGGVAVGSGSSLFAITEDGAGSETGTLRKFDATGTSVASVTLPASVTFPFPEGTVPGATTPVLGSGGLIYATANNGNLIAADQQNLAVKWFKALPTAVTGAVVASPTLDCNRTGSASTGIYYFATTTGWLVAYIVDSPGLDATATWPKYQHDARNTGNTGVAFTCP